MGSRGGYTIRSYRGGSECTWRTGLLRSSRCILKPSSHLSSSARASQASLQKRCLRWLLQTTHFPPASATLLLLALLLSLP